MELDRDLESPRIAAARWPGRRRATLLTALLAATLAVGAAAHWRAASRSPGSPPPTGDALRFHAPGPGPVHFSGELDRGSVLVGGDGRVKMELVMRGDAPRGDAAPRVPTDLVVILDRSGSMAGEPLDHARAAVRTLFGQLAEGDRFALVSYASDARLEWPLEPARAGHEPAWHAALSRLGAHGGTNMAAGIDLANATIRDRESGRAARVVLLSDGHANQGDHSLPGLRRRAAEALRGEYVFSTAGVGQGFDETLMATLADAGTGNFYYVPHAGDLSDVFAGEFAAARETVASALEVAIRTAPGIEVLDAAGYPLTRAGDEVSFHPGDLFAGQERRIWVTLRAPSSEEGSHALGRFAVSFKAGGERQERVLVGSPRVTSVRDEDDYYAAVRPDAWSRSVVVDEYNALRRSLPVLIEQGDEDAALAYIGRLRAQEERANAVLQRPEVAHNLDELADLEAKLKEVFAAPSPVAPARQNELRKQLHALGYSEGRVGARYEPSGALLPEDERGGLR